MENQEERKVYRETIAYAENDNNEPVCISIGEQAESVDQIISGNFKFLELMGVDHIYIKFFTIFNNKVNPYLPQNWDMEDFILETCNLIPSDVRFKTDQEIWEDLMYETIHYIIESYTRWRPWVLENDTKEEIVYNVQQMESYLIAEKVLAKVYYNNPYIHLLVETILELFESLKKEVTLVIPKQVKMPKKEKVTPNNLQEMWLMDEEHFVGIMNYLKQNGFITILNGQKTWIYSEGNATNKVLAGFLVKCQEEGFIKLIEYSGTKLKQICENTFNITFQDSKAFQPSSINGDAIKYSKLFALMPTFSHN